MYLRCPLSICLVGLCNGDPREVRQARLQLDSYFKGDRAAMAKFYGWRADAPVLTCF